MRIFRFLILLSTFLLTNIYVGCKSSESTQDKSNIVAKYDGGYTVTTNELYKFAEDWLYFYKFKNKSDALSNALNDLLVDQFKRMDFFEKGLDKDEKLIQGINRIINEELVTYYFNKEYIGKYVNEEYAKKIYKITDKQIIAKQIVLNKPDSGATQAQINSVKEKALKIKSELDNGSNFDSLVIKYSQDKQSLQNNGYMPPVGWKQSIIDPLGNVIFSLNKNDVRVLNDNNAFRIVKIVEINKVPVEPFDKIKKDIMSYLKNGYYQTSIDEYEKDAKGLIDKNSLKWNESAIKQIIKWSDEPNFYKGKYEETFKNALANDNNKTILTYNKGIVDYKEYLRLLDNILILPSSTNNLKEDDLKKFILEAIRTDLIVKKADSLDLKKNIFNPFTENPALKYQLVILYNKAEIDAKIPDTTDEALHKFFKENENTMYYQLEKRNIFEMVFPNRDEAENASKKIKQGIPFEKVTGRYFVWTYIKDRNGEIKSYQDSEKPVFGEIAFKMKESEISEPISFEDENNQTKYAILKCFHIRPEKQLTYNDVKNSITEDFKNYYRKIIANDVEKELKNKYHPEIFEDVLKQMLSSK